MDDKAREKDRHDKLLTQARAHWKECTDDSAERENRERGREDAAFAMGQQWDEQDLRNRERQKRPCLTFNRMNGFLHMVENEQRRNRASIIISPVDSDTDPETARVNQGLIRYIQYNSKSEMAVQAAFMESCRSGLGAIKLTSDYADRTSFDQDLYLEQIPDAINRVWWDPFSTLPDRSDSRYFFEAVILPREEFKRRYPKSEFASDAFFSEIHGNLQDDWITENGVRVANYYYIEMVEKTIVQLPTGEVVDKQDAEGGAFTAERNVWEPSVRIAKVNGYEVLEETEWKGSTIPVFPIIGEESYVDGRRVRFSLIHFAKDAQKLYNYYRSNEAEAIGLAPKSPWVIAEGQIEGYEDLWRTANVSPHSALVYKQTALNNQTPVPPPQRITSEPPIQALSIGAQQAADDMKAGVSIYDPSLGERSNETSGTAISQRQQQASLANLHFADNLAMAMCAAGRAIVEVKPFYYDTDRLVRILGEDEKQEVVRINAPFVDDKGKQRHYDLSYSKYDVRVSAGPSYMTQRQEAWASMTEWVRSWPQLLEIAGDLIMRNSDIPGADAIAERLKKTINPELTADKDDGQAPIPPQVQAQMQAMSQTVEQLTAALNEAMQAIETKQAELASRERIASLQAMTQVAIKEADLGSRESIEEMRQYIAVLNKRLDAIQAQQQAEFQPEGPGADTGDGYPEETAA